ncbi:MAG: tRNA epoxyqueuosine(34) reductase QueG [candidate division KSB1 bacterium]|nr:tRNA epoxyqueuosine(34) reductase QueG [candidate division KSB1 bacterium]MDZ7367192.1 tRNA epoxyqueuosine(34) reductase QueG [candidate division KSB1 bacterium]MDZ7405325.1 tRNA epoxyqueuosine(34) reductase QueG [candidate division KSB1 bacterium]
MKTSVASLTERIKSFARDLGCELVGVAPLAQLQELGFYPQWLQEGHAGEMHYMERQLPARLDPRQILPEAQSVIVIGIVYHTPHPLSTEIKDSRRGWISRYAWGDDYHDILREKLAALHKFLEQEVGPDYKGRYYVDTGPVLDRVFAKYAGLGWFGKNTNLINQRLGSWFFIGELITNLVLEFDAPPPDRCGTCRRCLDACPTDAFVAPYVLDAQRCISYLTIELRGEIPEALRPQMGQHVFGCDICQDVCPWNRKAAVASSSAFAPRPEMVAPKLDRLAELDEEAFRATFRRSPVKRAKWRGFMRNVLVAIGNSGVREYIPIVAKFLQHPDELLREHGRWAYEKLRQTSPHFRKEKNDEKAHKQPAENSHFTAAKRRFFSKSFSAAAYF